MDSILLFKIGLGRICTKHSQKPIQRGKFTAMHKHSVNKSNYIPDLFHVYQLWQASNNIAEKPFPQLHHSPPHVWRQLEVPHSWKQKAKTNNHVYKIIQVITWITCSFIPTTSKVKPDINPLIIDAPLVAGRVHAINISHIFGRKGNTGQTHALRNCW